MFTRSIGDSLKSVAAPVLLIFHVFNSLGFYYFIASATFFYALFLLKHGALFLRRHAIVLGSIFD